MACIIFEPAVAKYIEKVAVPEVVVDEVVPEIGLLDTSDNVRVHDPVNKAPSSPLKVAVIIKLKYTDGDEALETIVKDDSKFVTVAEDDVAEEIPVVDVARMENVPADNILSPLKVIWPLVVLLVSVPVNVPVGERAIVIEYEWAVSKVVPVLS